MIDVELARALRAAGVRWSPGPGDRFVVDAPDMDADTFWVSDMTVEVHRRAGGVELGFNGTTEWALDSVGLEQALWLPREDQLRGLLAEMLVSLVRDDGSWVVTTDLGGDRRTVRDADVERAYATALLDRLT